MLRSKKSHRAISVLLAVPLLSLALTACGDGADDADATEPSDGAAVVRIAFFAPLDANSFLEAFVAGAEEAAEEAGAEFTVFQSNGDADLQLSQVQTATSSNQFDAFLLVPANGAALVAPLADAVEAGIQIGCLYLACGVDPAASSNQIPGMTVQIGADFAGQGAQLGDAVKAACEDVNPCEVAYVPGYPAPNQEVRKNGFLESLGDEDGIEVVASDQSGKDSTADSLTVTQALLSAHPDLDVLAFASDQMAAGGRQALDRADLDHDVRIIGLGASRVGVEAVASGDWFADAAPSFPRTSARMATEMVIAAAAGETVENYLSESSLSEITVLYQSDAGAFTAEWEGN